MDKKIVIELIVAQISNDLEGLIAAAKATHAEATDQQNKAENKYDTRALEAGYLAQGQSRQVAELKSAREAYESLPVSDFLPRTPIDIGALVTLKQGRQEACYLIGPKAGGIEIVCAGTPVTVITPHSPLGRQLMGRKVGESVTLPGGAHRIASVS